MSTSSPAKPSQELANYLLKQRIITLIRNFFHSQLFTEVTTPKLVPAIIPESYLRPFTTNISFRNGKKQKAYLITSPESSIKKLLSLGLGNTFEITQCFRNSEEGSRLHLYEFMMIEWYRVNENYQKIMHDCEDLFVYLHKKIIKSADQILVYQNREIDLTPPWKRLSVRELLQKYANIKLEDLTTFDKSSKKILYPRKHLAALASKKGYTVTDSTSWEEIFHQIFFNEVEPQIAKENKPVFVYDYPTPLAALSKVKKEDPYVAERFELYIAGLELANCFSELTDYLEQKIRFNAEKRLIKNKYGEEVKIDENFLKAVKKGLPQSSGIALGIDRVSLLLTNSTSVHNSLFFA